MHIKRLYQHTLKHCRIHKKQKNKKIIKKIFWCDDFRFNFRFWFFCTLHREGYILLQLECNRYVQSPRARNSNFSFPCRWSSELFLHTFEEYVPCPWNQKYQMWKRCCRPFQSLSFEFALSTELKRLHRK